MTPAIQENISQYVKVYHPCDEQTLVNIIEFFNSEEDNYSKVENVSFINLLNIFQEALNYQRSKDIGLSKVFITPKIDLYIHKKGIDNSTISNNPDLQSRINNLNSYGLGSTGFNQNITQNMSQNINQNITSQNSIIQPSFSFTNFVETLYGKLILLIIHQSLIIIGMLNGLTSYGVNFLGLGPAVRLTSPSSYINGAINEYGKYLGVSKVEDKLGPISIMLTVSCWIIFLLAIYNLGLAIYNAYQQNLIKTNRVSSISSNKLLSFETMDLSIAFVNSWLLSTFFLIVISYLGGSVGSLGWLFIFAGMVGSYLITYSLEKNKQTWFPKVALVSAIALIINVIFLTFIQYLK